MTSRTLQGLGIGIVVMIVGVLLFSEQETSTNPDHGRSVFPELMSKINDISLIMVTAKTQTATITRDENVWVVKEKSKYPADLSKVRELLLGLAELKILEPKTKNPELYDKLGLQDVTAEDSLSHMVTTKDGAGKILAEAVIGKRRPAKGDPSQDEVYIRIPGDPQTWLAIGNLPVEPMPGSWLDKSVYEIEPKRVKVAQITHPDGTTVELEKETPEDLDYQLVNIPKGAEIQSQFTLNNMVSTLAALTLEDVKAESEVSSKGKKVVTAVFETFDGLEGIVKIWKDEEQYLISVSTAFNPTLIWKHQSKEDEKIQKAEAKDQPASEEADKEPDTIKPEKPTIKPAVEVNAEVEAINKKVSGWVYIIPKFRADTLLKKPEDLLKKPS